MQMTFRMDCPACKWGNKIKSSYINQGILKIKCSHCGKPFYFKVTVTGINIEVFQEKPKNSPCKTVK